MDIEILEDIGLTEAEIKTYLALLELGQTTSGPIITKSKLQSSVVHRVLKTLIDKGLVSYVTIGKNKHYQATDPQSLINFVDNKKSRLQELLPKLHEKQQLAAHTSEVRMYMGKTAIFRLLDDLIKAASKGDDYLSFSLIEEHQDEEIIRFYRQHNPRRNQLGLNVKVLVNRDVKDIYEENYDKKILRNANIRYSDVHFPQGLIILNDNVVLLNWSKNPTAVRITDTETSQQFKEFFTDLYEQEQDAY